MFNNSDLSKTLDLYSKLMDMFGENSFKVKNYQFNAGIIKKIPEPLNSIEAIDNNLQIGAAVKNTLKELITSGVIQQLEHYKANIPEGLIDLLKAKGFGAKKVATLWKENN